jgi:hypothetical protein
MAAFTTPNTATRVGYWLMESMKKFAPASCTLGRAGGDPLESCMKIDLR